jgi:DNA-binding TFAR19-related protein (PDSD5 family)
MNKQTLSPQAQQVLDQVRLGRQEAASEILSNSAESYSPKAQERLKEIANNAQKGSATEGRNV